MAIPKEKIIHAELSYKIIGAAFSVFNALGSGLAERDYQQAMAKELEARNIKFEKEKRLLLPATDNTALRIADFVIDRKIVLELKVVHKLGYSHAKQLLSYLKSAGLKLGILLYFTNDGVKYRRVLNPEI